jgi:Zn finger protein HypA/HybF involved in hydrogenase expression
VTVCDQCGERVAARLVEDGICPACEGDDGPDPRLVTDGGRSKCVVCDSYLPDEIDEGSGVYCPNCGHGQHVTDGGRVQEDTRQCSECDRDAVPGSQFCHGHIREMTDGSGEVVRGP